MLSGGGLYVGDAVLKSHIHEIRQALGDAARTPRFIETVHRRGYRFVSPIRTSSAGLLEPPPPSTLPVSAAFVGRQEELVRLQQLLEAVRAGARHVAFVTGEPGIGKTMLLNTFLAPLRQSRAVWIAWGQCIEQYGAGAAYLPVLEALSRLLRSSDALQVIEVLRRVAPTWLVHMPEFVERDSLTVLERSTAAATPERMLYRIYGDLCRRAPELAPWLAARGFPGLTSAEAAFERAIEVARKRGARAQELRAALDLAKLWQRQGAGLRARQLLEKVYAGFTEGHRAPDLVEARRLLDELDATPLR
jgi:hypothetical protein